MFGLGHHGHHGQNPPPAHAPAAGGSNEPTFKLFCKADEGYCLSVRDGNVVLAPTNPRDVNQHWFKDMRFSNKIKDEEGNPAFAIVNKATGLAVKHSLGQGHPVKLVPYNPEYLDESVMWTESGDVGKGFRCIRMVNNIRLNFDALNGDKDHGGVHDGTTIVLWEWAKGDNQSWKILPWGEEAYAAGGSANAPHGGSTEPTVRIFCKADEGFSATVRNGEVVLAPTNPRDEHQHWFKDMRHSNKIKDEEGYPAFALVNKVTGQAIKHSQGEGHPVNIYLNFDALNGDKDHGGVHDGTTIVLCEWAKGDNQSWKILPWGEEAYAAGGSANAPHGGSTEPTVRIVCKADEGFSATVRNGEVVLAPTKRRDEQQHWFKDMRHKIKHWFKDMRHSNKIKVTGQAIKHSQGEGHPVKLVPYNPNYRDVGAGFTWVNNIYLNFDALNGEKDHGGVRDGTTLALNVSCR